MSSKSKAFHHLTASTPSASSTASTTLSTAGLHGVKAGDRITLSGSQHATVQSVSGNTLDLGTWTAEKSREPKLQYHKDNGHAFWPKREERAYECSRCKTPKEPGTKAEMSCDDSLVNAVHDL